MVVLAVDLSFLQVPICSPVFFIHHSEDDQLIRTINRSHWDIPNRSKTPAVVQVLVLQAEEIPNETPEDLEWRQDGYEDLGVYVTQLGNGNEEDPDKPKHQVFNNTEIV